MKLTNYRCAWCDEDHKETKKPNQMAMLEGKCTANHKVPPNVGNWRVCHATFDAMGGPNPIGSANLCNPCFKRILAPAFAMRDAIMGDTLADLKKKGLLE